MAKAFSLRSLVFLVVLTCFIGCVCPTWWNPLEWRVYWKDALRDRDYEREAQPQQPHLGRSEKPLKKDGINTCAVKIPTSVTRECHSVVGRRRLKCSSKVNYVTKYECCPGYEGVEGKSGCPKELYVSKRNIIELAKNLGLSEFVKLVTLADVGSELILDTKYTAFIPTNEAFQAMPSSTRDTLLKDKDQLRDLLMFHVLPGKVVAESLKNNMILKTMDVPNKLRVNVDRKKKVYVVQGSVVRNANQGASNGIVHVIDKVIRPSSGNLRNYLKGNPKFSVFNQLLRDSGIILKNVTVFAPSNKAFDSLPAGRLDKLLRQEECVKRFLSYHVLRKPIYSQLLYRHVTMEGHFLDVITKDNTTLLVNDAMVTTSDVTTDDGIVHVIDKVLMPFGAMNLLEAVNSLNLTKLASLFDRSGLARVLQNSDIPFTLFAPTDEAFEALRTSVKTAITSNPDTLRKVLSYHLIDRRVWTYDFGRDTLIKSYNGTRLRLNSFRFGKVHAANGGCVVRANLGTCNSVVHIINKVLIPVEGTIYNLLSSDPRFSTLVRIIQGSSQLALLTNVNGSTTFFAPTNKAFVRLGEHNPDILQAIQHDPHAATQMLKSHMVGRTIYSCGLQCKYSYWSLFARRFSAFSMARTVLRLSASWNGRVFVNGVRISNVDVSASNGVIHELDKIFTDTSLPAFHTHHRFWKFG